MSEEHKMTKKDKLALGITLAAIFGGVFVLGLIGLIINPISPKPNTPKNIAARVIFSTNLSFAVILCSSLII